MDDNNTSLSPDNILLSKNGLATYEWLMTNIPIPVYYRNQRGLSKQQMWLYRDKAVISIPSETPLPAQEEVLLHELCHVYQYTHGFPDLITEKKSDPLYEQCTTFVSSIITDQGVDAFLRNNKIILRKSSGASQYLAYKKKMENWASPKFNPNVMLPETLTFASIFANLYFNYNKQKALYLVDVMSRFDKNIRQYTETLIAILVNGDPTTADGCREMFQACIDSFSFMEWHISDNAFQSILLANNGQD